jgi:hypothetical protein
MFFMEFLDSPQVSLLWTAVSEEDWCCLIVHDVCQECANDPSDFATLIWPTLRLLEVFEGPHRKFLNEISRDREAVASITAEHNNATTSKEPVGRKPRSGGWYVWPPKGQDFRPHGKSAGSWYRFTKEFALTWK